MTTANFSGFKNWLKNYVATMAFIIGSIYFYTNLSPFHARFLNASLPINISNMAFQLDTPRLFWSLAVVYALFLFFYYWRYIQHRSSAAIVLDYFAECWRAWTWQPLTHKQLHSALKLCVKFFFVPLMLNWMLGHVSGVIGNSDRVMQMFTGQDSWLTILFSQPLYWFFLQIVLFVDLAYFNLGYLVELPFLENEIYTVESTLFGWLVCLACYPPFNTAIGSFLTWQSQDYIVLNDYPALQFTMNTIMLVLFVIYTWASVALGWKASNLTNRGVVARGPYAYARHPAYGMKNLSWWVGALPTFYAMAQVSLVKFIWAIFCMASWSFIYYLRALTEEWHLLRGNNGYAEYQKQVKYRFIPGLV